MVGALRRSGSGYRLIVAGPHIQPRGGRALRFLVDGRVVFAAYVRHPGTRPNKFLARALRLGCLSGLTTGSASAAARSPAQEESGVICGSGHVVEVRAVGLVAQGALSESLGIDSATDRVQPVTVRREGHSEASR